MLPCCFEKDAERLFCGDVVGVRSYYVALVESPLIFKRGVSRIYHGRPNVYYTFLLNAADLSVLNGLSDAQIMSFSSKEWKAFFGGGLAVDEHGDIADVRLSAKVARTVRHLLDLPSDPVKGP